MIVIINASPLIYLGKIGALTLLPKLFSRCYTTTWVKKEVLSKKDAPEYPLLKESFSDWLIIKEPIDQKLMIRLKDLQIHLGEASIISLAKELQDKDEESILIVDDLTAREIARTLEIKITGTLGVILKALSMELITKKKCKNLFQTLIENTAFRISTTLYSKVLKKIDDF